jgi:hypothetical protein
VGIGFGEVSFDEAVRALIFYDERKMSGVMGGGCDGVVHGAEEDGERMGAHDFEEDGAIGELVEFGSVHMAPSEVIRLILT